MRFFKKSFCTLAAVGLFYTLSWAVDKKMHGFSYQNFTIMPPEGFKLEGIKTFNKDQILNQRFHYFNCGGESLVFTSEDHLWVLKLFKKHRLYPYYQFSGLKKVPLLKRILEKRELIYNRFWTSLKIQSEHLAEFSALYYINLPQDSSYFVELVDPIGSIHRMDLGRVCFALQKKGELFKDVYNRLKTREQKQDTLRQLVQFYKKLDDKGFRIWDNAVSRNMGWIDGGPFVIDTGSVALKSSGETFDHTLKHLKTWITKYDPEALDDLLEMIAAHQTCNPI